DLYKVKSECSNCGYSESKSVKEADLESHRNDVGEDSCPQCNSNSFSVVEKKSIIVELGEIAEATGAEVDILSTGTEEGEMLYSTFGGIAAILRYKIDY
ncbi:MAG: peptide chain release factor 1, partial [Candidatus Lokiarchaeia archaeon]|nr:peptide chain release factor 1 [Candidatus Lokiarchaeia archaeon]